MLPTSAELTYFYEVAITHNISQAALKLRLSQPSLSMAIKRIENTVGTALFVRHKQGVTLTLAGKKLLHKVEPLLQQWHRKHFIELSPSIDTIKRNYYAY